MSMAFGLYEQLINGIINEYLSRILSEVLEYIDDDDATVRNRVDLCNSIILHILDCIDKGSYGFKKDDATVKRVKGFLIHQDSQVLLSLIDKRNKKNAGVVVSEKAVRPDTSIVDYQ